MVAYNPNGCTDTFSKSIEVLPLPEPDFEAKNVCLGDTMQFINKSNISNQNGISYLWRFGDGNTSSAENPVHLYTKYGKFDVTLYVTGLGGCMDSITNTVTVGAKPNVSFSYTGSCLNDIFTFIDLSKVPTGKIVSRKWDFGDGNSFSDSFAQHQYTTSGKYRVSLEVSSESGCTNTFIDSVEVYDMPVAKFTADTVCLGKSTTFKNTITANASSLWLFGDGDTSTTTSPTHYYKTSGNYTAILVVASSQGCKDSFSQTVVVKELPSAEFTFTISADSASFSPVDQTLTSCYWDFGDGSSSTVKSSSHTYANDGNYTVTLVTTNSNGCTDTVHKQLTIKTVGIEKTLNLLTDVQVFPNPFRTSFTLKYSLQNPGNVKLLLLDIQGKEVLRKNLGLQSSGEYSEIIKTEVSAGTYMLQLEIDGKVATKKVVRVK
jgi:PKD repeat protein